MLVSGGTDNHLMTIDLRNKSITGKDAEKILDSVRITTNKNTIPNDPQSPFITSGVRIGTPAVTTRGMGTEEMKTIAKAIALAIEDVEANRDEIIRMVDNLCINFSFYIQMKYCNY